MLSISILKQTRKRRIQKVPTVLRLEERNRREYDPFVASFGPYHHGKPELKLVEDFKPKAFELLAAETGMDPDFLYNKVLEGVHNLRNSYAENSTDEYDDGVFARMMLLDACLLVSCFWMCLDYTDAMSKGVTNHLEVVEATINENPLFEAAINHLGVLVLKLLFRDMVLLENQVPFCLLKLLMNLNWGKDEGEEILDNYLTFTLSLENKHMGEDNTEKEEPPHLLAEIRRLLVVHGSKLEHQRKGEKPNQGRNFKRYFHTFRSVTDLKAKGINFKPSPSHSLQDVNFKSLYFYGELQLPICFVTVNTRVLFLNLIAFEMCPNNVTDQTVSAYINFMKSLIVSPEDVKELREKKILINALGNDDEVMQVYKDINTFGADNYGMYYQVKEKIQEHYSNKAKTWAAELKHTYLSSPWTIIALLTAIFLLCLAFLQSYFTIHPSVSK